MPRPFTQKQRSEISQAKMTMAWMVAISRAVGANAESITILFPTRIAALLERDFVEWQQRREPGCEWIYFRRVSDGSGMDRITVPTRKPESA